MVLDKMCEFVFIRIFVKPILSLVTPFDHFVREDWTSEKEALEDGAVFEPVSL